MVVIKGGKGQKKTSADIEKNIESRLNMLRKMISSLQAHDLLTLVEQIRDLRHKAHEYEYWLDEIVREQKENNAKEKALAILKAGYSFDGIIIDKVHLTNDKEGTCEVAKISQDEIPF